MAEEKKGKAVARIRKTTKATNRPKKMEKINPFSDREFLQGEESAFCELWP